MAKANTQMFINLGAKGIGAIGGVALANNFLGTIMGNQILAYSLGGISVGAVLTAGIGIWAVESLILK